jgi:hypothetical protein
MRIALAALFSIALIGLTGHATPTNIKNSEIQVAAVKTTGQTHVEHVEQPETQATQVEEPAPQQPTSQSEQVAATPQPTYVSGSHEDWMTQAGIDQNDWAAVNYIVSHESSWRYTAQEPTTGAYGLCQALPATKMSSAGEDWLTNPVTQLKWCTQYAQSRYGSWWGAYSVWTAQRWW